MMNFFRTITSRRNDDGASAVEYGLLVAGIAALIVAVVFLFGNFISGIFSGTCTKVQDSAGGTANCAPAAPANGN